MNTTVRQFQEANTQAMIKALRAAGLTVNKDSLGGYECKQDDTLLFAALPGRFNYLLRMRADLFE